MGIKYINVLFAFAGDSADYMKKLSDNIIKLAKSENGDVINPVMYSDGGIPPSKNLKFYAVVTDGETDLSDVNTEDSIVIILTEETEESEKDGNVLHLHKYQRLSVLSEKIIRKFAEEKENHNNINADTLGHGTAVYAFFSRTAASDYARALGEAKVGVIYISLSLNAKSGGIQPDEMRALIESAQTVSGTDAVVLDLGGTDKFSESVLAVVNANTNANRFGSFKSPASDLYTWHEREDENGRRVNIGIQKEITDKTALKMLGFAKPPFVFEIVDTNAGGDSKYILSCDVSDSKAGTDFVKLSRIDGGVTSSDFAKLTQNLTDIFAKCEDYLMNPFNFIIHENYIYVNKQTFDLKLIYVPYKGSVRSEKETRGHIADMGRRIAGTDDKDRNCDEPVPAAVVKESKPQIPTPVPAPAPIPPPTPAPIITPPPVPVQTPAPILISREPSVKPGNVAVGDFELEPENSINMAGAVNIKMKEPAKIPPNQGLMGADLDVTYVPDVKIQQNMPLGFAQVSARLDYCGPANLVMPKVIRIEPVNNLFSIGRVARGKSSCEYSFPESTSAVSKKHAVIREENGKYFITDMDSTYGTFIANNKLQTHQAVELNDGDKISFGNVAIYEFKIEKPR